MKPLPNGEFAAPWKCPRCLHINKDSISPQYGPFVTCTCGGCYASFDNSQLDAASVKSLERARDHAEVTPARVDL